MLLRNVACCSVTGMFGLTLIKNVCRGNPRCGLSESEALSFSSRVELLNCGLGFSIEHFFLQGEFRKVRQRCRE